MHDLSIEHITEILKVYKKRTAELFQDREYVQIFKNHGPNAGTSLVHSHTQLGAIDFIPPIIEDEIRNSTNEQGCEYCKIIEKEKNSDREIAETDSFVSFCPYAPRFNFESWIFPKKHIKSIVELNDEQLYELATIIKKIILKLAELNASYNMVLHCAPRGKDLHFHIEILPRIAKHAGMELGTGVIINSISPEDAAAFYRE
jgi:UDPglucose--hexose-1-phosphate uridylyltransferase